LCHLQHKLIGFITEMKSVYCAVRTGSLNEAVLRYVFKGLNKHELVMYSHLFIILLYITCAIVTESLSN
jgi:hypothetical protein